ncbi:MAG: hypothetical protein J7J07_08365 [Syntrophobacterales bacterium]|nr:hypothetical protein [Syntrophobacterales bacterium]
MRHVVKTLLIPDTGICAKNACLRACLSAVQAAVIEDKDFYCGLFII